ncbi:MAG TPA: SH3 domain-containing protein [Rhizomicrobium sp.]|jgi:hypothetical protein
MRASTASSGVAGGVAGGGAIPLDLAPLLAAYGRERRVALRVERLPDRARFSRGRNNGDRSWSLNRDELDELYYIPPKGSTESHTLSVRVVGLDSDNGTTLAIHEVEVAPGEMRTPESASASSSAAPLEREAQRANEFSRMREELAVARMDWESELGKKLDEAAVKAAAKIDKARAESQEEEKARLADLETRAQQRISEAREQWQRESDAALAKAEAAWRASERGRLAIAEAQWRDAASRDLAAATTRCERAETALSEREAVIVRAQAETEQARRDAQREIKAALSQAEKGWKDEEAKRLAAADARVREQSARALADATERCAKAEAALVQTRAGADAARQESETAALRKLRDELAAAKTTMAERDAALTEARAAGELLVRDAQRESRAALARAEGEWKAAEAGRTVEAQTRWREDSARTLAEMTARCEKAESAFAQERAAKAIARTESESVALKRLRDELAAANSALGEREAALTDQRVAAERAQKETRRAFDDARSKAEADWSAGEATRLAEAQARWRKDAAGALADSQARCAQAEAALAAAHADAQAAAEQTDQATLVDLRGELTATKKALTEARAAAQRATEGRQREMAAAVSKAEKIWKAGEGARLAAAEAQGREEAAVALADARARCEQAEAALAHGSGTAGEHPVGPELNLLQDELSALRRALAERELALARAEKALEHAREIRIVPTPATLDRPEQVWGDDDPEVPGAVRIRLRKDPPAVRARRVNGGELEDGEGRPRRRMMIEGAIVAGFAAALVVLYPRLEPLIAPHLPFAANAPSVHVAAKPQPAAPAPVVEQRSTVNVSQANVRAAPSANAAIVTTLPRGTEVTPIEQHGGWVHVRIEARGGKESSQGWIFGTSLKNGTGA